MLDKAIDASDTVSGAKKLKDVCQTRWVERIDAYSLFATSASSLSLPRIKLWFIHTNMKTWAQTGTGMVKRLPKPTAFSFSLVLHLFL